MCTQTLTRTARLAGGHVTKHAEHAARRQAASLVMVINSGGVHHVTLDVTGAAWFSADGVPGRPSGSIHPELSVKSSRWPQTHRQQNSREVFENASKILKEFPAR